MQSTIVEWLGWVDEYNIGTIPEYSEQPVFEGGYKKKRKKTELEIHGLRSTSLGNYLLFMMAHVYVQKRSRVFWKPPISEISGEFRKH